MKKIMLMLTMAALILAHDGPCQEKSNVPRYFGNPIITDTLSTMFIPTRYNEEFLSTHKIALLGDYYANIVVYNFKADSYSKLFPSDSYIAGFRREGEFSYPIQQDGKLKNLTPKWVFMLVKNIDYNGNGRIDEHDPSILFATTIKGENLKALTAENENIVAFDIFDKQGFVLIKIQRDSNEDGSFKVGDRDFYFKKIDLNDLSIGKGIEVK